MCIILTVTLDLNKKNKLKTPPSPSNKNPPVVI